MTVNYSFVNPFTVPVRLDIYGSRYDYGHNSNRIAQYILPPKTSTRVALSQLTTYWLDWYSNDYSLNNWATVSPDTSVRRQPLPLPPLTTSTVDDTITLFAQPDTSRSVMFPGTDTVSYWKMGLTDDTSLHGTYEATFRKAFELTLILHKDDGSTVTEDFSVGTARFWNPPPRPDFDLDLRSNATGRYDLIIWHPSAGSRDTLMLVRGRPNLPSKIGYYPLLRQ
jgi:hypothetical protein